MKKHYVLTSFMAVIVFILIGVLMSDPQIVDTEEAVTTTAEPVAVASVEEAPTVEDTSTVEIYAPCGEEGYAPSFAKEYREAHVKDALHGVTAWMEEGNILVVECEVGVANAREMSIVIRGEMDCVLIGEKVTQIGENKVEARFKVPSGTRFWQMPDNADILVSLQYGEISREVMDYSKATPIDNMEAYQKDGVYHDYNLGEMEVAENSETDQDLENIWEYEDAPEIAEHSETVQHYNLL